MNDTQGSEPEIMGPVVVTLINGRNYRSAGTVFLTSGGRVVIDCGWGEYFDKDSGDTPLCSLDELRRGYTARQFIRLIQGALKKRVPGK